MGRMDKYVEKTEDNKESRINKNERLYNDKYLNNSVVEIDNLFDEEEEILIEEKEIVYEKKEYVEKNYSLNDFLETRRKKASNDNLTRKLSDKVINQDHKIEKIVESINEKEEDEDIFSSLLGDDDNTIETGCVKEDNLNNAIDENLINNYVMNKDIDETNSFLDINDEKKVTLKKKKIKKLPIIFFLGSLLLMIGLIIYLILR